MPLNTRATSNKRNRREVQLAGSSHADCFDDGSSPAGATDDGSNVSNTSYGLQPLQPSPVRAPNGRTRSSGSSKSAKHFNGQQENYDPQLAQLWGKPARAEGLIRDTVRRAAPTTDAPDFHVQLAPGLVPGKTSKHALHLKHLPQLVLEAGCAMHAALQQGESNVLLVPVDHALASTAIGEYALLSGGRRAHSSRAGVIAVRNRSWRAWSRRGSWAVSCLSVWVGRRRRGAIRCLSESFVYWALWASILIFHINVCYAIRAKFLWRTSRVLDPPPWSRGSRGWTRGPGGVRRGFRGVQAWTPRFTRYGPARLESEETVVAPKLEYDPTWPKFETVPDKTWVSGANSGMAIDPTNDNVFILSRSREPETLIHPGGPGDKGSVLTLPVLLGLIFVVLPFVCCSCCCTCCSCSKRCAGVTFKAASAALFLLIAIAMVFGIAVFGRVPMKGGEIGTVTCSVDCAGPPWTPAPFVMVYDKAGNYVDSWGGPGDGYDWPCSSMLKVPSLQFAGKGVIFW